MVTFKGPVRLADILEKVCWCYETTIEVLSSPRRSAEIALARQVFCYLAKRYTSRSDFDIGLVVGRERTTVLYSYKEIEDRRKRDPRLDQTLRFLETLLTTVPPPASRIPDVQATTCPPPIP